MQTSEMERQTEGNIDIQKDRWKHIEIWTGIRKDGHTESKMDIQKERWTGRKIEKQTVGRMF